MRLLLDILVSAVFAVFSAVLGFFGSLYAVLVISPIFFKIFDSPVAGLFLAFVVGLGTVICGFLGFPLCGIWLDQQRQKRNCGNAP